MNRTIHLAVIVWLNIKRCHYMHTQYRTFGPVYILLTPAYYYL